MAEGRSKTSRILDLYQRLCAGRLIRKTEEARHLGVDERSIQRDIDDIRAFLEEQAAETGEGRTVVYDHRKKGFLLQGGQSPLMSNSEILAVSKILLESRAFSRQEMSRVLDKLISGCVPQSNMKLVSDLLANEKFHYVELTHPAPIQDKLWDMGSAIQQRTLMELEYQRQGQASSPVTRVVEPVSILFSEYYFYLNAYIVEMDQRGRYVHKYDYPAIFRIDRIEDKVWEFLINYDYPGNVRELKNTIDRMVVLSENHVITTEGIPILYNLKRISPVSSYPTNELVSWKEFKRRSEREYLEWALRQTGWNISATARELSMSTRQIFNKINEYNIEKPF